MQSTARCFYTFIERGVPMSISGNAKTKNVLTGKVLGIPVIDKTLTKSDRSADAKVVGDEIARLDGRFNEVDPHFAENVQYDNENSGLDATNMQGAIDEISGKIAVASGNITAENTITSSVGEFYRFGNVCTVVFDFTTKDVVSLSGQALYTGLPKPKAQIPFQILGMSTKVDYGFTLYTSGMLGTGYVNDIPSNERVFGSVTYICE